jgi:hypothetical protein
MQWMSVLYRDRTVNRGRQRKDDSLSRVFVIGVGFMDIWDVIARSPKLLRLENNRRVDDRLGL